MRSVSSSESEESESVQSDPQSSAAGSFDTKPSSIYATYERILQNEDVRNGAVFMSG